jgi:very-short-patch-repair endonuclease
MACGRFAHTPGRRLNCFKRPRHNSDTYSDFKLLGGAAHAMPFLAQNWPLVVFVVGAIVVIVLAMVALRDGPPPYERRGVLLSPAEINFLRALTSAVREDWLVFSKVRLPDIIKVRAKTRKSHAWQSRIQGKHLDFVLCDYETLEVKLAIELDDGTRPRNSRDRFVDVALTAAGLTLLHVRAQEKYETAALRKDIEDALGILRKKKRA